MLKYVSVVGLTRFFYLAFGDNYVTTNKDNPILSATTMFTRECSFRLCKVYTDIRYGSHVMRCQLTVGWSKTTDFQSH